MSINFHPIDDSVVSALMPIENACHSHPWSEKTFRSCIGKRYFGEFAKTSLDIVGFYVGEYLLGEATLMDICVSPEHQGKGLGNAILEQFHQQAKRLGASKLWLEVRASNTPALMLYINHGYQEISRRAGYYPKETGYEDAIVMCKQC
ncbi:ribosomal protein S18-alanine N-acetyltransferase [Thalassotalea euphylliae]|uniref:ribosomal protein S18-alanine N-acetyltransferase n=1 Tax=Thalassotalea euphylliae TaxID=1655234 RepID=UPI00363A9151